MSVLYDLYTIAGALPHAAESLSSIDTALASIGDSLKRLADVLAPRVVGIAVEPGTPHSRTERVMAKCKVSLQKKSQAGAQRATAAKAGAGTDTFVLVDNQDDTCTVLGVDAAGNPVDIAGVVALAVTSDDPGKITVDPPAGMTFQMHAVGPLTTTPVNVNATATWNDGSIGPFSFSLPVDVIAGGPAGIKIVPGTPVPRP